MLNYVVFMHITTFGRSIVVLRTLFSAQPKTAWMPA
ncbi:unknown [Firmicutes bacterium CAG:882]|nr:unknown [Firmicutes bacterium CAG:882]